MPKRRRGGHSKTKTTPGPKEEKVEEPASDSPGKLFWLKN